jgi:putative transcriptional regulator
MNDEMFAELEASLKEGVEILRGEIPPTRVFEYGTPDVKSIRKELELTQHQFAALMGISVRTLQNWEQKRRIPEGPARILLMVAARHPQAVLDVVKTRSGK